jgi:hypothetical protein
MELQRLFSLLRIITALLAATLIMNLTGYSQVPPAASDAARASRPLAPERSAPAMSCAQDAHPAGAGGTTPAPNGPAELGEQILELCSALRLMRAEVSEARSEVVELRQDLKSAREQLVAIKSELPQTTIHGQAEASTVLSAGASREAQGPQLDARISKTEEEQQLLSAKVDDQYQSKVESGSKYRVRLSGMALFNAFTTRGATNNFDVPDYATPHYGSESNAGFGATARQSLVGLDMFGPTIAGARSSAEIQMDFYGGFPETSYGITTGLVRLRTAGLRLDWDNTSLVAGQEAPFFSPLSPTSLVSVANPALASAGNLWVWTPQIFIEHRLTLTEGSSVSLQGGLLDPLTGQLPADSYDRAAETGEKSGQPAYAARVAWSHGSPFGPVSVGAGGYCERQNWGFGRMVDAWAGTADWSLPFSHRLSLTGEFYRGRAIGGLGAAEGRSIAFSGELDDPQTVIHAPNSTGGWGQLKFMALPKLEFNGAFGEDFSPTPGLKYTDPDEGYDSLPIGRNQSVFFNGIYHLRSNLIFSLEYRRLRTAETQPGLFTANQVGLAAAALF